MKTKILIVEDDPHIVIGLEEILKSEDFEVATCNRGDRALEAISQHQPGLIILDVMLPGMSGFDVCKKLRSKKLNTPVLMLTAKGQEIDKVVGLDLGADDYVTKPFGVRELLSRIHGLMRRAGVSKPSSASARSEPNLGLADNGVFKIGHAAIDPKSFQVSRGRNTETLTARELKLLQIFYGHHGEVLSRDRLLSEVWGYNYYGTTRTLDQVIVQLRRKLGDNGTEPKHLLTVHGVGYKLVL
jgi:Response regulators consisting of a CheY-like receiver domain and a winged-helix DNA-binding domain